MLGDLIIIFAPNFIVMIAALEHPENGNIGLKDVTQQLSQYIEDVKYRIERKKAVQKQVEADYKNKMFIDDLMYNYSTQKSFFDFFDSLIRQEGQKMIANSSKDEAMYFCEQLYPYVQKIEQVQMKLEERDFESLDAFFAFNSAYALMNSIIHLLDEMNVVAERETDEYLDIIAEEVKKSLQEPVKRTRVDSLEQYLNSL